MGQRTSQLTAAGALTGDELVQASQLSATVTRTATTISAQASDNSYNDSGSGFVTAGFTVGNAVKVTGFTGNVVNNIASAVVTAVTAGKLTIGGTDGDVIVDDAAGESVTITQWNSVRTTTQDVADLATPASGGTKTYAVLTPMTSQPSASDFATLDTRNSIAVLDFDASTVESATWVSIMPEAASLGSGLKVRIHWTATTATSGDVVWGASIERGNTDLDADSYDTEATATGTANGTSGIVTVTEITITTIDSIAAGDMYRLKIRRNAGSGSDTMTGDAELIAVEVRSAA